MTLLGNGSTVYPDNYAPQVLETFKNKHPENKYLVTFHCPEFTSLCPKTGQPDFAIIIIRYSFTSSRSATTAISTKIVST